VGQPDPAHIARLAGSEVHTTTRVSGGYVSDAVRVHMANGQSVFVKHTRHAPAGLFRAEAHALAWIADAGVDVPEVVGVGDDWLALEWIDEGEFTPEAQEQLGRAIARMHRAGADGFGAPWDGFAGPVPVPNDARDTWPAFLAECRIIPLAHASNLPAETWHRLDDALANLPDLVGPPEPPARVHGDLWAGNRMVDADGVPVLIDPDAYGGHREMDLAMMRVFGGFPDRVFDAYAEEFPPEPGWQERMQFNQLVPVLVHCAMYGGKWIADADQILRSVT
jgi:fructosamine-3-kinase